MTTTSSQLDNALAIAKAQGAIFIQAFLRAKKSSGLVVRIGSTKTQSLNNLAAAIDNNIITLADLDEWICQVEGWGKQHIYLYEMPSRVCTYHQTDCINRFSQTVRRSAYHKYLDIHQAHTFPTKLQLQQILIKEQELEIIWRQRAADSMRTPHMDPEAKTLNGDLYEFRAYRITPSRNVVRFIFIPTTQLAALLVQLPMGQEHRMALTACEQVVKDMFELATLSKKDLSETIKKLDQLDMNNNHNPINLEAHSTKFTTPGAAIEFSASKHISGFKQVEPVRLVRRALNESEFTGESGQFNIHLDDQHSQGRTIQMSASSINNKFYFKAKMNASEIKKIINYLAQL